jgi:hypothetical protein
MILPPALELVVLDNEVREPSRICLPVHFALRQQTHNSNSYTPILILTTKAIICIYLSDVRGPQAGLHRRKLRHSGTQMHFCYSELPPQNFTLHSKCLAKSSQIIQLSRELYT